MKRRLLGVIVSVVVGVVVVAGCHSFSSHAPSATPHRTLGPGEQWVPVALDREMNGVPLLCAGVGWVGGGHYLTGSPDDPRLAWMVAGQRSELEWPVGYSARFTPKLELLDADGKVVGRDGDELIGGCEMEDNVWDVDLSSCCYNLDDLPSHNLPKSRVDPTPN